MSQERKKQLIDQLFKVGNLYDEFSYALNYSLMILRQKYQLLADDEFGEVVKRFGWKTYLPQIQTLYEQQFSEEELEQIIQFWSSEVGRKLVRGSFATVQKQFHLDWAQDIEEACQQFLVGKDSSNEDDQG